MLQGLKSDQDRFVVCPDGNGEGLFVGVFDGHGKDKGRQIAELAMRELPGACAKPPPLPACLCPLAHPPARPPAVRPVPLIASS
jgi:hypothetical protein